MGQVLLRTCLRSPRRRMSLVQMLMTLPASMEAGTGTGVAREAASTLLQLGDRTIKLQFHGLGETLPIATE